MNNFMIKLTKIGAEVLSFTKNTVQVVHSVVDEEKTNDPMNIDGTVFFTSEDGEFMYLAPSNNGRLATDFVNDQHIILEAANTINQNYESELSLYQTFDGRVKCSLDSHLATPTHVFVQDGKQKNTRTICEVFFDKQITTTTQVGGGNTSISGKCYSGQYPIVKKSSPYKQWHKLLVSYGLRFMRFHLFVTYREFDIKQNSWAFNRYPMSIDANNYFDFTILFISEE